MSNSYILNVSCEDKAGIVAALSSYVFGQGGFVTESAQYSDPDKKTFFMRMVFESEDNILDSPNFIQIVDKYQMNWQVYDAKIKPRLLIMVSKQSHCLNDLLHRHASGLLDAEIVGVVSNHQDVEKMTKWFDIDFHFLPIESGAKEQQEQQVIKLIDQLEVDLVVLARYMQILTPDFVEHIFGRAINIHHSFLPSFKGAKPYHQAYEKGVKIIGATAHYVSNDLDEGPIIEQEVTRVNHTSTPKQLVALGQDIESLVLSRAVQYHIEHRVMVNGEKTVVFS